MKLGNAVEQGDSIVIMVDRIGKKGVIGGPRVQEEDAAFEQHVTDIFERGQDIVTENAFLDEDWVHSVPRQDLPHFLPHHRYLGQELFCLHLHSQLLGFCRPFETLEHAHSLWYSEWNFGSVYSALFFAGSIQPP